MLDPEIEARVRALRQGGGGDDLSHAMRDPQVAKYVEMAMRLPDTAVPRRPQGGTNAGPFVNKKKNICTMA